MDPIMKNFLRKIVHGSVRIVIWIRGIQALSMTQPINSPRIVSWHDLVPIAIVQFTARIIHPVEYSHGEAAYENNYKKITSSTLYYTVSGNRFSGVVSGKSA